MFILREDRALRLQIYMIFPKKQTKSRKICGSGRKIGVKIVCFAVREGNFKGFRVLFPRLALPSVGVLTPIKGFGDKSERRA